MLSPFAPACSLLPSGAILVLCGALTAQGGGLIPHPALFSGGTQAVGPCVSAGEMAAIRLKVDEYLRVEGALTTPAADPARYGFFPQAGQPGRDLFAWYYCDLDATSSIREFLCGPYTYDGHEGIDSCIRTFGEQDIGVPIFAAADGRVITTDDGHPDRNVVGNRQPNNFVVIDHGNGRVCFYWHMRKGSVAVAPKDYVRAGQQIGMTGSSGHSGYPHLHFATYDHDVFVEPHSGPCRAGTSGFNWQPTWQEQPALWDCGITRNDPTTVLPFPERPPVGGQIATSDPYFYFWAEVLNHPANSTWRARFKRPDSSVAYESPVTPFSPSAYFRWWPFYWRFDFPDLHVITGNWTFELEINNVKVVTAPFVVTQAYDPDLNHPPEPITVELDSASPNANEAVFCRVTASLLNDDLDYDLVRFRFEWRVNNVLVRDVVNASHADALAAGVAITGDGISCTVTPNDGRANGTPVTVSTTVRSSPWSDLGFAKAGMLGDPSLTGVGVIMQNQPGQWLLTHARPQAAGVIVVHSLRVDLPFLGGTLVPAASGAILVPFLTDAQGQTAIVFTAPAGLPPNMDFYFQSWLLDDAAIYGVAASNGLQGRTR